MSWYEIKLFLTHSSGFSMDALHVIAGVVLQMGAALLFRRSLASPWPWLSVLLLELVNEANDLWVETWPEPWEQYGEGMKDLLLTVALPTLLLLTVRYFPRLYRTPADSG